MSFISTHDLQAIISYHSAALGVFPGGVPWEPDSIRLAKACLVAPRRRYRCRAIGCGWEGTLRVKR